MYYIKKRFEIAGSHSLNLPYESKCKNLHGHNWIITVHCKATELDGNGMIVDFSGIKKLIKDRLDHKNLNDIFDFNPTAENIAYWIWTELSPYCFRVDVQESENNISTFIQNEIETYTGWV